jgi:hypothetical protein
MPQHILAGMKFGQVSVGGGGDECVQSCDDWPTLACGVTVDGDGYCWGNWTLSWVPGTPVNSPLRVLPTLRLTSIIVGNHHACGIAQPSRQVYCWGANYHEEVGVHPRGSPAAVFPARLISNSEHAKSVGLGQFVSCILQADNRIFCWGGVYEYLLGTGRGPVHLSGPDVPVRLSHCTGTSLSNPELVLKDFFWDHGGIVLRLPREGLLLTDSGFLESIVDVYHRVAADRDIAWVKIRTCEISSTDPVVAALYSVSQIGDELAKAAEVLFERAAGPTDLDDSLKLRPNSASTATAITAFQRLAKMYREAASVQVLTDLRP